MSSSRPNLTRLLLACSAGIALLSLAACGEDKKQANVFESEAACRAEAAKPDSWWTLQECTTAFAQAQDRHINNAPRYEDSALCEQEHGAGQCQNDVYRSSGGNSSFMPMMAGYFMGRSSDNTPSYQTARPLYSASSGGYSAAGGTAKFSSLSGAKKMPVSSFKPATSTIGKPAMTRAQATKRGGFGSSKMTRTSRSSFGGSRAGS